MKNNKGFTLLELIISAGILGLIITTMTVMLMQQQRQFNFTKELADIDTTGRSILNLIASEVRNAGARQGKAFSLNFVNGGSVPNADGNSCIQNIPDSDSGTKDSLPDCLTIYTWDLVDGIEREPRLSIPSIAASSYITNFDGDRLIINLPDSWYNGGRFIGRTYSEQMDDDDDGNNDDDEVEDDGPRNTLIGLRSREKLCNPNPAIQNDCRANPGRCSECSVIFRAELDNLQDRTATIDDFADILDHNLPEDDVDPNLQFTNLAQFIRGIDSPQGTFGLLQSITSGPSELTLVRARSFRVDLINRGLEMIRNQNINTLRTIAGGIDPDNPLTILEEPGIVDLQFVFNISDPDGNVSTVGACDFSAATPCNTGRLFSDFDTATDRTVRNSFFANTLSDLTCCEGREQDIYSVDITLVLKSKIRPVQMKGGLYQSEIPPIADVALRRAPKDRTGDSGIQTTLVLAQPTGPSITYSEPQEGFIYRVFTTTVYLRNLAREEPI